MLIRGGVRYTDNGIKIALKAMQLQQAIVGITNENVTGFDKVGYQRKEPVVSSFTEYLGVNGLSEATDTTIGRISTSDNPLDLALNNKGYFQVQGRDGIRLTRDGRFKLDKQGNLLTLEDQPVLSNSGAPIRLPFVPDRIKDVVVNTKGQVSVFNKNTKRLDKVATLGIVDSNGVGVVNPEVAQGFLEYSNVAIQNEFLNLMPTLKAYDANRQILMIENSLLQKTISQLSSAQ